VGAHPEIWLFRHGETAWSKSGQHTGRTDLPLTEEGIDRAKALGARLKGRPFSLVLSSPMSRAMDTCRFAGYGDQVEVTDDLQEWDYGAYEGRTTPDIQKERPGWSLWKDGVVDGETVDAVGVRARRVIERALAAQGDVALFAHGHMLRILTACWLGLPPAGGEYFALGTGAVCILGFEHDYHVILHWNEDGRTIEV
jgi:broad specificity phosphatase PhoE